MSASLPPLRVSSPAPPLIRSLPAAPESWLASLPPYRVSPPLPPTTFSKPLRLSTSEPVRAVEAATLVPPLLTAVLPRLTTTGWLLLA